MDSDLRHDGAVVLSPDDLQNADVGEAKDQTIEQSTFVRLKGKIFTVVGAGAGVGLVALPASAADESMSINWTPIADLIEGAGTIMPSIGSLLIAAVGVIMIMMVMGFVTGIFGAILDCVKDIAKFR